MKNTYFTYSLILLLPILLSTSYAQAKECPTTATIKKVKGLKSRILEKPKDKQQLILGKRNYILIVNNKMQLVIDDKKRQQVITTLKSEKKRPLEFIEIEWAGDGNKDCEVDILIWKKAGVYLGKYSPSKEFHEQSADEKIYIESQPKNKEPFKVQSLGKY